jgi:phosphohistidine phosphatase
MKTLFLLRHAQTMPGHNQIDAERLLTPRGQTDAEALGRSMLSRGYVPEAALCSTAQRTRMTLDGVQKSLTAIKPHFEKLIYTGDHYDVLSLIQSTGADISSLLVVAHNPSIHALAGLLAADDAPAFWDRLGVGFQTGTLCVLECPAAAWADIRAGQNRLKDFMDPIDYNAPDTPARWT